MRCTLALLLSCYIFNGFSNTALYATSSGSSSNSSSSQQGVQSKIPKTDTQQQQQKTQTEQAKKKTAEHAVQLKLGKRIKELEGQQTNLNNLPEGGNEYPYPGVVVFDQGWQGSDNVYNISKYIAVGVDISVTASENQASPFPIKDAAIRSQVRSIFIDANIAPYANNSSDLVERMQLTSGLKPPLPLFMVVIIAQPINKGYAVYCAANLFEDVDVKRAQLKEGTWQAITWERQHLIVGSNEEIAYLVKQCVDDLAYSFVKTYRFFEYLRPR